MEEEGIISDERLGFVVDPINEIEASIRTYGENKSEIVGLKQLRIESLCRIDFSGEN